MDWEVLWLLASRGEWRGFVSMLAFDLRGNGEMLIAATLLLLSFAIPLIVRGSALARK